MISIELKLFILVVLCFLPFSSSPEVRRKRPTQKIPSWREKDVRPLLGILG